MSSPTFAPRLIPETTTSGGLGSSFTHGEVDAVGGCPLDGENTWLDLVETYGLCDREGVADRAHLTRGGHDSDVADLTELFRERTNTGSVDAVVVGYEYVENGDLPPCSWEAVRMVGTAGFEPTTTCTPSKCATRLRYVPVPFCSRRFGHVVALRDRETLARPETSGQRLLKPEPFCLLPLAF